VQALSDLAAKKAVEHERQVGVERRREISNGLRDIEAFLAGAAA
jgi:hypothetical protein